MRLSILALLCVPTFIQAESVKLTGEEINALLPMITAYGDGTKQVFHKGGTTDYISGGRPSVGYWRSSETQYCSKWPPFGGWTCYDVFVNKAANELSWIGDSSTPTVNRIEKRNTEKQ